MDRFDPPGKTNIFKFPASHTKSKREIDPVLLPASQAVLDELLDREKDQFARNYKATRGKKSFFLAVFFSLISFALSLWAHFFSLELMDSTRSNPNNLDYEGLLAWHTKVAEQISHLSLLSNASFVFGAVIFALVALSLFQTGK